MELQVLTRADLVQINLGTIHGMQVVFLHGRFINVREDQFKSVIIENAFAVQRFNHPAGGLALAESGNIDPAAQFQISLLHRFIKLLCRDGERQFRFVSGNFLVGVAHEYLSSIILSSDLGA